MPEFDGSGIIRARRALIDGELRPATVRFESGVIREVGGYEALRDAPIDTSQVRVELDDEAVLFPGLVDPHVHINEPGRSNWEGFDSATRAAAKGGITTLVDMPLNSIPATTDVEGLRAKRAAAAGCCHVDVGFWGGLVPGNSEQLGPLAAAGVLGFKSFLVDSGVEEFEAVTIADIRQAAATLVELDLPLLVHAEAPGPIEAARDRASSNDPRRYAGYLASRPDAAELEAIVALIELAEPLGLAIHIVHLSSATALPAIEAARSRGVRLSVETAPHYLALAAETIADGRTEFKCAPPIRDRDNREALWQALTEGTIDFVATDHSPCPPELKLLEEGDFFSAWGGIASLELSLAIVWSEARRRSIPLARLGRWLAGAPAERAGLGQRKGRLAPGFDADMIAWFPQRTFHVQADRLQQRHTVTPYLGRELHGVVETTFLRGRPVWHAGSPAAARLGRLLST